MPIQTAIARAIKMIAQTKDILAEICNRKRTHVAKQKSIISEAMLSDNIRGASTPRGFISALKNSLNRNQFGFICEIKKASPSKGLIRPNDFDPAKLAAAYEIGGASCLSVLTDEPYFQGSDAYFVQARQACELPVLRKDFMVDPYQIIESRALGADCILLIMAALDDTLAAELESAAMEFSMDVLIEVHNSVELDRALKLKSPLIGVNNRNLKTMAVTLDNTLNLVPKLPDGKIAVAESGLKTKDDLKACSEAGANCFLIGETFMRQDDVSQAVKALQKGVA